MEFRLLGPLEVFDDTGAAVTLGGRRERAVLAALLLRANRPASTAYLVEAAWEVPPASPESNLRTYVSGLRKRLGPEGSRLTARTGSYQLRVLPDELDVEKFDRLCTEADSADRYAEALALWRDEPLQDLPLGPAARAELAGLEDRRVHTVERWAAVMIESGQAKAAIEPLMAFVERHPLREELWAQLMTALYRSGRRAEALETYTKARNQLVDAIGVDPGPRLRDLQAAVLRDELDQPTTDVSQPIPAQLPADILAFTGRQTETELLLDALHTSGVVTVDGMAGIGKTALATHVAHLVREQYPDGQLFLDLHGHTAGVPPVDSTDALDRMLRALGVSQDRIPSHVDDRAALYRSVLAGRRVLVLLDNAESEQQVRPLLPGTAGPAVLVTSRTRLTGLESYAVSLDVLPTGDALNLFSQVVGVERIAAEPADLVADVVELCGHLPLAVRIAAARLRSRPGWTLAHLAERLGNQSRRLTELAVGDRGVAAAFALSYQQLSDEHQHIFRLFGLHPGAELDAAALAALANSADEVESALETLLDAHLVQQPAPDRYRMHDLVRAYATTLATTDLDESTRAAAVERLFEHYATTAEQVVAALSGPADADKQTAAAWLEARLPDLMAMAALAAQKNLHKWTIGLAQVLSGQILFRGYPGFAATLHTEALSTAQRIGDRAAEMAAWYGLGEVHSVEGRKDDAIKAYRSALSLAEELGDQRLMVLARHSLGNMNLWSGRLDEARAAHEAVLGLAERIGDHATRSRALHSLGNRAIMIGDHGAARAYYLQAMAVAEDHGDQLRQAQALDGLANVERITGRSDTAISRYRQALDITREIGDAQGQNNAMTGLASSLANTGDFEQSLVLYRQALDLARKSRFRVGVVQAIHGMGRTHRRAGRLGPALRYEQEALEIFRELGDRNGVLEAELSLGEISRRDDRISAALRHLDTALQLAVELKQRHDEARVRRELATTHAARGATETARRHWEQALAIFRDLDAPEAVEVERELSRLGTGSWGRG